MKIRWLVALTAPLFAVTSAEAADGAAFLAPHFVQGQTYSTVFSILHSTRAQGFEELARRNGGSADYTVLASDAHGWRLRLAYRYDGRPPGEAVTVARDAGRTNCNVDATGKEDCQPYLDGSGLVYNPLLWGDPPARLTPGMSWKVNIAPAWELGGVNGVERVTVVSVDSATGTVVLLREGESSGLFGEGESAQRKLTREGKEEAVTLTAGKAHWKGYTTVVKGVIFSDSLLVTRDDTVQGANGAAVPATERWIMLLNAAPYPTLPG